MAFYLSIIALTLFWPIGLHLPYFPVWLAARGFSESEIAVALGLPTLLRVAAAPVVTAIADKRGIAATLAACAAAALAAYCFLAFVNGFLTIFAGALGLMVPLADALTLAGIRRAEVTGLGRIAMAASVYGRRLESWERCSRPVGSSAYFRVTALAGLTLLPALVTIFAATKLKHLHTRGPHLLPTRRSYLRLAVAFIGAAALIQASHAEYYSFATLHWKVISLTPNFIGAAWAIGVTSETVLFLLAARYFAAERNVATLPCFWRPWLSVPLARHERGPRTVGPLSPAGDAQSKFRGDLFWKRALARRHCAGNAPSTELPSGSALSLALATFASGWLTSHCGEKAYLAMAALAMAGLVLVLIAGAMKRPIQT
jgi:PPP family 3-phenylpropionic acid transporter